MAQGTPGVRVNPVNPESNRRVAFIGPPGRSTATFASSFERLFREAGGNTGNHAFWYAVAGHFVDDRKHFLDWNFDPAAVKREFDTILLPSSNFVHAQRDMGGLCGKLEACELPIVVVGLGAQAPHVGASIDLKPGTIRFLRLLAERCTTIGVRGTFTASILADHAVDNVEVLGCPSNLINLEDGFETRLQESYAHVVRLLREKKSRARVSIAADLHRTGQHWLSRRLYEWASRHNVDFVCQHPNYVVQVARDPECVWSEELDRVRKGVFTSLSREEFREFAAVHFSTFFCAEAWLEHARRQHLSIGTRFHGNMIALQAGCPALFIIHDSRTDELTEACGVPAVTLEECRETDDFVELFARAQIVATAYEARRRSIAHRYVALLANAGLTPLPALLSYSARGAAPT